MDTVDYELWLKRSVSGAANVTIDSLRVMFGDMTYVYNDVASDLTDFLLNGNDVFIMKSWLAIENDHHSRQGFRVAPRYPKPYYFTFRGLGGDNALAGYSVVDYIDVVPRWSLA